MLYSVITITYNNLEGLKRTCESLRMQSYGDYEWIVVDGASNDGTENFLKTTNADWKSKPDNGIYDAMNKGIDRASGEYLIFMNAGDIFAANNVLEETARSTKQKPDFIYGDALEDRTGKPSAYKSARHYSKISYGLFTHHQAMLYRRDKIKNLRYDLNYKISADYKFTAQFLRQSDNVLYCPIPICLFESGGLSQTQVTKGRKEQMKIRKECGITSPIMNALIYIAQSAAMTLRRVSPALYWKLR